MIAKDKNRGRHPSSGCHLLGEHALDIFQVAVHNTIPQSPVKAELILATANSAVILWVFPRYRPEIPEPAPSLSQHGAPIGGIWVFPMIEVTVIHQMHVYCGLSVKINAHEMPHGAWRLLMHFICVCLHVSGWQIPKYLQLELYGWRHHTWSSTV